MGWTLFACFGGAKKRKRPNRASKFGSKSKRTTRARGYEPLQSDDNSNELDISEPLSSSREKPKDEKKAKIRKKVRFNLDVVTYEPLSSQNDEHDYNWEERGKGKETEQAAENACVIYAPVVISKTISTEAKLPLYSLNYRYNNCYDGEDEYEHDDNECQISEDDDDDDDDDDEDEEDDGDSDAGRAIDGQKLFYEEVKEEELHDCSSMPLVGSATNTRFRSHYIVPVLNPIENLSQWKAVKTRTRKYAKF